MRAGYATTSSLLSSLTQRVLTTFTRPQTPPQISLSQLKTLTLKEALAMPNSVYSNCEPYVKLFEKYADKHGLPPILLAAFAMQESGSSSFLVPLLSLARVWECR